jgi:hypothetical protein
MRTYRRAEIAGPRPVLGLVFGLEQAGFGDADSAEQFQRLLEFLELDLQFGRLGRVNGTVMSTGDPPLSYQWRFSGLG